jgi:trehalose/maltose hydrolase-like predicted phosphorylase
VSNGKIAVISDTKGVSHQYITTTFDFNNMGTYTKNITEVFQGVSFDLFSHDQIVERSNISQELDMYTATFKQNFNTTNTSNVTLSVDEELRVLRQYPYCTLKTINITPDTTCDISFFNNVITPTNIGNVRYNNNVINPNQDETLYMFNTTGLNKDINKRVSLTNSYSFSGNFSSKGYNIERNDTNLAFNKFTLSLVQNETFTIQLLSTCMTELDFSEPELETQRIAINIMSRPITSVIAEHVKLWAKEWESNISITKKDGITDLESTNIDTVNKHIQLSLYNIFSVVRDDVDIEMNPNNISTMDITGHIFWNGELWFIPVLIFLKPKAARTLLDYRYLQLEKAKKLAAAHGYKGSKYAYENDIIGYNNVYWDNISPLQIFNTALISICVWNFYRVSRDLEWLRDRGYPILKNNADFFVSKIEYDEANNKYNVNNVFGIENKNGNNNALSNFLMKEALKYASEATYEINTTYQQQWATYIDYLSIPIVEDPGNGDGYNIIKLNDEDNLTDTQEFLEQLIILHPFYSKDFFSMSINYTNTTIVDNITKALSRLNTNSENNPFNRILLSTLYGTLAQTQSTYDSRVEYSEKFNDELINVFTNATLQPWSTFKNDTNVNNKTINDIGVSAAYILNLLTSIGGLKIYGGISETRFYYEEFAIKSSSASVLPKSWKKLRIDGVGYFADKHYCTTNSLYYS